MTARNDQHASGAYDRFADYGLIGNLRGAALVSARGSIDWCCLPELDGPSCFAAILDARRGGRWRLAPPHTPLGTQRYVAETNVLETRFATTDALVVLTDFMPVTGDLGAPPERLASPEIVRLVRCEHGEMDLELLLAPRFDYARDIPRIAREGTRWVARGRTATLTLDGVSDGVDSTLHDDGATLTARWHLRAGDQLALVARLDGADAIDDLSAYASAALERTCAAWEAWARAYEHGHRGVLGGPWHHQVLRSGLVLKLLTHRHTGAVAAAPTTSLPEQIGGVRNWDYRYTWIRDAAFTAQALVAIGHRAEGRDFLRWVQHAAKAKDPSAFDLHIMYGLHGESLLHEEVLDNLEGYRGSRPVRVGNAAAQQFQLDIYGELLSAAYELVHLGGSIEPALWTFLSRVADRACDRWREPDHGIWEVRAEPRHYVYSKVMAWVALDRALRLAEEFTLEGNVERWRRDRRAIREAVLAEGYDRQLGSFVQSFGSRALDASLLLLPLVEFLPPSDPRVQGTIDRVRERLMVNGIVYRYVDADALPGHDGAFGLTTFWMVNALALSHRADEARELFEGMVQRASPLGLYAEEFDPRTGELLGNFPQAFTHIGFINSALYLARAEGRPSPPAPVGTGQHAQGGAASRH